MYLPTELVLDLLASWSRLFAALALSIIFSLIVGITAATNRKAEGVILPLMDILQTLPILAFFPVAIYLIVSIIPNYIGINLSVVLLIFTSMSWNITFGVYEAVKAIPSEFIELAELNHISGFRLVSELYVPAAMPRIAYQSIISWSVGLFYLVTSEIFSIGSKNFSVAYGIGAEIAKLVLENNPIAYAEAVLSLIAAIILTDVLFLRPLSLYSERFSFSQEQRPEKKSIVLAFYRSVAGLLGKMIPRFSIRSRREVRASLIENHETRLEKAELKSSATVIFLLLVCALFAVATVVYNAYSYLPAIAAALSASFARVWFIYAVCAAISIPLGIKVAKSERLYAPAMEVLQVVSAIPATILLPAIVAVLFLMPFGNELTALSVIFLSMVWYLLFSVVSGMRTMPQEFKDLVGIMRMKWTDAWKNVYVPAILPSFVTGSITAVGGAWNALIVAEYFSIETSGTSATCMTQLQGNMCVLTQVSNGIGKLLDIAAFNGNLVEMGLALGAMVVMIVVINRLVWQRVYKKVTVRYRMDV